MSNVRNKTVSFIIIFLFIFLNVITVSADTKDAETENRSISDIENKIDEFMNQQIGKSSPGAAVTVVKDSEVIISKGYGYADLENKTPVNPETTVFEYGSISKLFTWVSVMQLVEQGKIELDEDIKNYLAPDFVSELKYKQPITMLDLMSHTAGFEEQPFDWLPFYPDGKIMPLEQYLAKHQPKQVYTPGEVIAYSNYGTALAGLVVEHVSGDKFYDYEMNHIFKPLGMDLISGNPLLSDKPELYKEKSKGYMPAGNSEFIEGLWTCFPEYPAGSVNGTINSLSRFLLALTPEPAKGTPLFQYRSTLDETLLQSYTPLQGMPSNAHGFWEYESGGRYLYHPGETASYTTMIAFSPEKRFGFAILANTAVANDLVYGLSEILIGRGDNQGILAMSEKLPDSNELSGDYLLSTSCYSSIFEAICHLTNKVKIKATGENEINMKIGGQSSEYIQISPYYYELKKASNPVNSFMGKHLYFEMQDGNVKRISSGKIDCVPLRSGRSVAFLWFSIVLFAASLLFFTVSSIVLFIIWIRLKTKFLEYSEKFMKQLYLLLALTLSGTILILNNASAIFLAVTDIMHDWQKFRTHIIINWIMLFEIVLLIIYSLYKTRFYNSNPKLKRFAVLVLIMIVATLFLLGCWLFF